MQWASKETVLGVRNRFDSEVCSLTLPNLDGFDLYYRVEKAVNNSQALGYPYMTAQQFLSRKRAVNEKFIRIDGEIPVTMMSPELWSATWDLYKTDVSILAK